jgi:Fe-Mn family superoxide dismutase
MTMHRRDALRNLALSAAALAASPGGVGSARAAVAPAAINTPAPDGLFILPPLGYAVDALEPHIDAQTMAIHHGKHHQAYIDNLNKALAPHPDWARRSIEDILRHLNDVPEAVRTVVRNNGGGHANHALFWKCLGPTAGGAPQGPLAEAVTASFGGFDGLKEKLSTAGKTVFGSGWAWLSLNGQRQLVVESTPNQDSPISGGHTPLLGIDVWEHAYYLKYQNRRTDYLAAIFNVVDWEFVGGRYVEVMNQS